MNRPRTANEKQRSIFASWFKQHSFFLTVFILLSSHPSNANEVRKKILVLFSYNRNVASQELIGAGLEEMVRNRRSDLEIVNEYLDIAPTSYPRQRTDLRTLFKSKYKGVHIDLVVPIYDAALDFLLKEGDSLWLDARVLALYSTNAREGGLHGGRSIVQVPLATDHRSVVEDIMKVMPDLRNVVAVTGVATGARTHERAICDQFRKNARDVVYDTTYPLSVDQIVERVGRMPAHSAIIFTTFSADVSGERFASNDVALRVAKAANAPVFCTFSSSLGTGVLGGKVVDMQRLGQELGRTAIEMLDGRIPPTIDPANYQRCVYDWRQVRRWMIPISRFPEGAEFIHRPASLWKQFKLEVFSAMALMAILAIALFALAIQNRKRKVAERIAKEGESWIRILIDEAPDAIVVYDVDRRLFIDANSPAEKLFGCGRARLLELGPQDFYTVPQPDGMSALEGVLEYNRRAMDGERLHIQRVVRSMDGRLIECEVYLAKLPTDNRRLLRASFVDVSDLRRAEAESNRYQANLHALIENTADMIWSVDLAFRLITFNQTLVDHVRTNYGNAVAIGMLPGEMLPAGRAEAWIPLYERTLVDGVFRQEYMLPDGRCMEFAFNPIRENGVVTGISVFGKDISERKLAQKELAASESKYRNIISRAMEGFHRTSLDGRIEMANPTMAQIFGHANESEMTKTVI
ncbi:MAG: PAS domain S-box protein, partial [Fibrobacterota bacterium]